MKLLYSGGRPEKELKREMEGDYGQVDGNFMHPVLRAFGTYYLLGSAAHTRRLLRGLSGVWFFLYCGMLFFGVFFWTGDGREFFRLPFSKPLVLVPAGYLGFCFCTSFARGRSWWLLLAGALAQGLLVMVVAQNASAEILGPVFMLAGLYISIVWWWMYAKLEVVRNPAPGGRLSG